MNIRDHSSQFTIYVFTTDVDQGASVKVYLSQAGYDAYFFQDPEALETRLKENPPHILVFSTAALGGSLSDFVTHVQGINDEIRFIAITAISQFDILAQYNSFGFVDVISDEAAALETRVVWSVDRACEKLYLSYQNEQLFDDLQTVKQQVDEVHKAAVTSMKAAAAAEKLETVSFATKIGQYRSAHSKEDLIQRFLNNISGSMCIFFKFLPSVRSFVATHGNGVEGSQIQGVGCQLEADDVKDLNGQLSVGLLPARFNAMLVEAFHFNPPKGLPLYGAQNLEGVFVYSGSLEKGAATQLNEEFALFSLCYSHLALEKKVDALEVQDFVTELHNRNYYVKILADEVSRSRRLKQPVSVVKIAMDDFYEIESSLGEAVRDELLKSVATVIAKTSRSNDQSCRTAANEMAMILPHCSKKGAALRAERLRRIIEGTSFLDKGMKVSISLGISEYPSLCDSAKSLDESATKALSHIVDKGGNKICLYKAPETHRPDFEVPVE
ncbi:GGDEF domain-containing protein [Bdellovibrio svalbardensis]|uniref:diguanylate cyclase n=1 Tax=Bdellovibrio svalbardensis TaxID=2972972 RepID=A0ABT6DFI1_9BACT|nr:GGDEF domain-containing protein [Bdellovibrio svalbardensis]MDG0815603.1 GGDEF domain-containing protein [Bdellovibrio svalbardensis]